LHSLTSNRPHRAAMNVAEAMDHIASESGRAFDPKVVAVLRKRHERLDQMIHEPANRGFTESIGSAQREGKVVTNVIEKLGTSLNLQEAFTEMKPALRSLIRFETLVLWVENESGLTAECVDGVDAGLCASIIIPRGSGVSGRVTASGKPVLNGDAVSDVQ